jgi:hypothetical protein
MKANVQPAYAESCGAASVQRLRQSQKFAMARRYRQVAAATTPQSNQTRNSGALI